MNKDAQEKLPLVLVMVLTGLSGFFVILSFFVSAGLLEKEEWFVFILSWGILPWAALILGYGVCWIKERFFSRSALFYPLLLLFFSAYLTLAVWMLRVSNAPFSFCTNNQCLISLWDAQIPHFETGKFVNLPMSRIVEKQLIFGFVIYALVAGFVLWLVGKREGKNQARWAKVLYGLVPVILGLGFLPYSMLNSRNYKLAVVALVLAGVSVFHKRMTTVALPRRLDRFIYFLVVPVIAYLVFDPAFSTDLVHQNHVLGPVSDLMFGKSLLVDSNCQYGVFFNYFVMACFAVIPISLQGLSLIAMILYVIQYTVVFAILRFLTNSSVWAFLSLLVIMLMNFFATLGGEISAFPSLGPLRFLWPLLLVYVFVWRAGDASRENLWLNLGRALVGVMSIWSFETFAYTLAAYIGVTGYEILAQPKALRQKLWALIKNWALVVPYILGAHMLLALNIHLRSGQWPQWSHYLDYVFLYSAGGWGTMAVAPWTPWILFCIVPFTVLVKAGWDIVQGGSKAANFSLVVGLAFLSVMEFTYFLGRSHINNIYHVSTPVLLLMSYGLNRIKPEGEYQPFYRSFLFISYFAVFFLVFNIGHNMLSKLSARSRHYANWPANFRKSPSVPQTTEALKLIDKYAKDKKRIAIFIDPDATTESLYLSRKVHVFPTQYSRQEEICPSAKARVLNFKHDLKAGDVIFVARESSEFQEQIVKGLQEQFKFIVRERSPSEIFVFELAPLK